MKNEHLKNGQGRRWTPSEYPERDDYEPAEPRRRYHQSEQDWETRPPRKFHQEDSRKRPRMNNARTRERLLFEEERRPVRQRPHARESDFDPYYRERKPRNSRSRRHQELGREDRFHSEIYGPERDYYRDERRYRPREPQSVIQDGYRERPIKSDRSREYSYLQEQKERKKSTGTKIFLFFYNLIFYTVTIGIIVMAVMFSFSSKSEASIFGYRFYNVLTDSMTPVKDSPPGGFKSGAITVVKLMEGSQTKEGDIVTFAVGDEGRYLTHRLVERIGEMEGREGTYVITKGDANGSKDPPINEDKIIGKVVFAIPKAGAIIEFVQEQFWACLVCILSLFGLFIVLKAYLMNDNESKKMPQVSRG